MSHCVPTTPPGARSTARSRPARCPRRSRSGPSRSRWCANGSMPVRPGTNPCRTRAKPKDQAALWVFRPLVRPEPPTAQPATWLANPIDAFILARLGSAGLSPAPMADRLTLIRRATFDLLGLPPTPAEIDAFLADRFADRPMRASSIACWPRPITASAGAGTGSTWPGSPRVTASSTTTSATMPGLIATT